MSELSGRRLRAADLVTGLVLIGLGAAMLALSLAMPTYAERGTVLTAPGIFPGLIAAVLLVLGAVLFLRSLRSDGGPGATADGGGGFAARPFVVGLGLMVLAIFLLGRIDFRLVSGGFCVAFAAFFVDWRGDRAQVLRRAGATLVVVLIAAVLLPEAFERLFLVRLP